MAALQQNLQVPIRTAMLDSDGKLVLEWQNFFTALVQAIPGSRDAQVQTTIGQTTAAAGDVRGAMQLTGANSIPLVQAPGILTSGPTGEVSLVVTYLTGTPGTGQSSHTVTFTNGIETAHT